MTTYALVNTMSRTDRYAGRIVSQHRSMEAAEKANASLQRAVRRGNGQTSYLPTIVVELTERVSGKAQLQVGQYRSVEQE